MSLFVVSVHCCLLHYRHDPGNHSSRRTAIASVVFMLYDIPAGLVGS